MSTLHSHDYCNIPMLNNLTLKNPTIQISVSFVARYTWNIRQHTYEGSYEVREVCTQIKSIGIEWFRNQKQIRDLWIAVISVACRDWEPPRKRTFKNKCQEFNHITLWQGTTIAPCLIHKMWQF